MLWVQLILSVGVAGAALPALDGYTSQADQTCGALQQVFGNDRLTCCGALPQAITASDCKARCEATQNCCGFDMNNRAQLEGDENAAASECYLMLADGESCTCSLTAESGTAYFQRDARVDRLSELPDIVVPSDYTAHYSLKCVDGSALTNVPDVTAQECLDQCESTQSCCGLYVENEGGGALSCSTWTAEDGTCPATCIAGDVAETVGRDGISLMRGTPADLRPAPPTGYGAPGDGKCDYGGIELPNLFFADMQTPRTLEECAARCDLIGGCCGINFHYSVESQLQEAQMCTAMTCDCTPEDDSQEGQEYKWSHYRRSANATTATMNVWEVLELISESQRADEAWFLNSLKHLGLNETLAGEGPFTVFVPGKRQDEWDYSWVTQWGQTVEDFPMLDHIVRMHIVPTRVTSADFPQGPAQDLDVAALSGEVLELSSDGVTSAADGSGGDVDFAFVQASNGVIIRLYDGVLKPTSPRYAGYETHVGKRRDTGLTELLYDENNPWDQCYRACEAMRFCCGFSHEMVDTFGESGPCKLYVGAGGETCEEVTLTDSEEDHYYLARAGPAAGTVAVQAAAGYTVFGPALTCTAGDIVRGTGWDACVELCSSTSNCCGFSFWLVDTENFAAGSCDVFVPNPDNTLAPENLDACPCTLKIEDTLIPETADGWRRVFVQRTGSGGISGGSFSGGGGDSGGGGGGGDSGDGGSDGSGDGGSDSSGDGGVEDLRGGTASAAYALSASAAPASALLLAAAVACAF